MIQILDPQKFIFGSYNFVTFGEGDIFLAKNFQVEFEVQVISKLEKTHRAYVGQLLSAFGT